jgi:hypothetical protein
MEVGASIASVVEELVCEAISPICSKSSSMMYGGSAGVGHAPSRREA